MHRWWAFTPPVWCEFGGFSRYNFYSELVHNENDFRLTIAVSLSMAMADHVVFVLIIS